MAKPSKATNSPKPPSPGRFEALRVEPAAGGVLIKVKVVPGASRTAILGTWNDALRVAVAAPPEAGKANAAVIKLLADSLGVDCRAIEIRAGQARPLKTLFVAGLSAAALRSRIDRLAAHG